MDKKPSVRQLKEMQKVLYDKDFARKNGSLELYEVHRNLKKDGDLRYDVTVIKPLMLGQEFVRTKGNCNSMGFQELYTVLEGEAIFFLQKFQEKKVEKAVALKAKAGQWVIVPPYYWVVTINPSSETTLETGNWVSNNTENMYKALEKTGGQCYYYTLQGWVKNNNYEIVPELRFEAPLEKRPESLDFLRTGIEE